jgi:hypothetical protein
VLGMLSITAGILLWRGGVVGYRMSLVLQGAQMLQLQSAALVYRVVLGIQVAVWVREGGRVSLFPGLGGIFDIGGGAESWLFGANLWAVAAFVSLEASPAQHPEVVGSAVGGEARSDATTAEPGSRPVA